MATRYNDQAVLEHYHCACTFEILYEDQFNITLGMDEEEFVAFRETVVTMILATDLSKHFDTIGKFKGQASVGLDPENSADDKMLCLRVRVLGQGSCVTSFGGWGLGVTSFGGLCVLCGWGVELRIAGPALAWLGA